MPVDITTYVLFAIIAALGGGAFGAAVGALPAFIFAGFMTIAGAIQMTFGGTPTLFVAAFGPFFGPHVGFAGGCAAHAYAAKKYPDLQEQAGWAYHDAKNILISLGIKPDILAVGAVFGAGAQALKMATDFLTGQSPQYGFAHIAWIVVLSAFVHRAVFGYSLIGDREKVAERVGSNVTSTTWLSFDYDEAEPHLPFQFYWTWVIAIGAVVGLISGYVTIVTGNPWLTFGISAASLIFLEFDAGFRPETDLAGTPVTHHITLPSAVVALATTPRNAVIPALSTSIAPAGGTGVLGGTVFLAMAWAVIFGVLGAVFRELTERLFYAWGDTHLDPPAFSITITVLLLVLLSWLGIIGPNAYQAIGLHQF